MAIPEVMKFLEHHQVAPSPGSPTESTLPLTFFDVWWAVLPPVQRLFFYELSPPNNTTTHFLSSVLPNLLNSLSLSLQHFYPLAGKLAVSPQTGEHELRYVDGDSVSVTVAECYSDFDRFVSDRPKLAAELHPLAPQLPAHALLALQFTVFPASGFSLGISLHHITGDGRSLAHFLKTWASISRSGAGCIITPPLLDRSLVKDPYNLKSIFLADLAGLKIDPSQFEALAKQPELTRATFVLGPTQIERLRKWVLSKRNGLAHCTPFVLLCSHVWVCLVRAYGEDQGKTVHFSFPVDCRARLDPPLPVTYFGNCIGVCFTKANGSDLMGEDGLAFAAEALGTGIHRLRDGVLSGAEGWIKRFSSFAGQRVISVAGSPKFRVYDTDFGLGRPRKTEVLSIEQTGAIYVGETRSEGGGIELGLALPKPKLEHFRSLFEAGLPE